MRFLEREVYVFLSTFDKRGERVRGAMPRARIFLFVGRPQKATWAAGDGPAADGSWAALRETADIAAREERRVRAVREKGKTDVFLFLGKRPVDIFFLFWMATTVAGAQLDAGLRRRRAHRMRHGVEHR